MSNKLSVNWTNVLTIDSIAAVFTSVEPSCNGYCDGSITIVVSGGDSSQVAGQAPYYQWNDVISNYRNSYRFMCWQLFLYCNRYGRMCSNKEFVLNQPDILNATIDLIEPVSCNGSSDEQLASTGGTSHMISHGHKVN